MWFPCSLFEILEPMWIVETSIPTVDLVLYPFPEVANTFEMSKTTVVIAYRFAAEKAGGTQPISPLPQNFAKSSTYPEFHSSL